MRATLAVVKEKNPKPKLLGSRWGVKGKGNKNISGGKSSILKGRDRSSCDLCGKQGHTRSACCIKSKAMASAKKETKDRNAQCKKDKAEKAHYFASAASASSKQEESSDEKDEDDKRRMNSLLNLGKHLKRTRRLITIIASVVIMILAILNKTIHSLLNL
jgi:hypothetical protein